MLINVVFTAKSIDEALKTWKVLYNVGYSRLNNKNYEKYP